MRSARSERFLACALTRTIGHSNVIAIVGTALLLETQSSHAIGCQDRWAASWSELEAEIARASRLSEHATLDSSRAALLDSLCVAGREGLLPLEYPSESARAWVSERLEDALIHSDPRFLNFFAEPWLPDALRLWDPEGLCSLPSVLFLARAGRHAEALAWIDEATFPPEDTPHAAVLEVEIALAAGDTLDAGARASRRLAVGLLPADFSTSLQEARVRAALVAGEIETAQSLARDLSRSGRLFQLRVARKAAQLSGDPARAESLLWTLVEEAPESREARSWLERRVPLPTAPTELASREPEGSLDRLLTVAEKAFDLDRFLLLDDALRITSGEAEAGERALRGARLAYKRKRYEDLFARVDAARWGPRPEGAYGLLLGRAYRNSAKPESMATWYGRAVRSGTTEERTTALWEWARELEFLRRFEEADSIYGRLLDAGAGERRADALLRRGFCRFIRRDFVGAARAFRFASESGEAGAKSAGQFWLYRVALAEGAHAEAREHLTRAAAGSGYYAFRALSATSGEPDLWRDVNHYWLHVRDLASAAPELSKLRARVAVLADSTRASPAGGRVMHLAKRLALFRHYERTEWADRTRRSLEEDPSLGPGATRGRSLAALGLPDLACRYAIRNDGSREARYPTPYLSAVSGGARRFAVAPEVLWSIMRRESIFEAAVRSPAGAVGLMQFMDSTARGTAARHGLPEGPLRSPRVNVFLGAAHVRELLDQAGGSLPLVFAGYNAGIENAFRWQTPGEDLDLYIERIGYRETREYVMAVLEGFWIYRQLLREH